MKKFISLIFISVIFSLFTASSVIAQDITYEDEDVAGVSTPAAVPKMDYVLPYPGILPDSPLWPIKDLRDRFMGLIIFDPVLKGYYNLQLADKRLAAGIALINGGKADLGVKTLVGAEKYLEAAVVEQIEAKKKGLDTATLDGKLITASEKHTELLLSNLVKDSDNSLLKQAVDLSREISNRVKKVFEQKWQQLKN